MSKISLEPNDSGAGTFSIVSPDSNTNRTLTLPDEAGKLLSTGNDDPAEVFKQSNILGTVSESGGVPTGAIIERDSNANGEYVKYADGTMICWRVLSREEVVDTSTGFTDTFFDYPATFAQRPAPLGHAAPAVAFVISSDTFTAFERFFFACRDTTRWNARLRSSIPEDANVSSVITAIGRWF